MQELSFAHSRALLVLMAGCNGIGGGTAVRLTPSVNGGAPNRAFGECGCVGYCSARAPNACCCRKDQPTTMSMSVAMQQSDNKRRRIEGTETTTEAEAKIGGDPYIGLDVGGRLFYCYQSTLTNTPGTLTTRFGGDFSPGGYQYVDGHGRKVYSIDRNPDVFQYILDYLRTPTKLPPLLVKFGDNPELWRALREEAEYFGLEYLIKLLKVTYSCSPELGDRGVLHWLGTRKGKHEYQNPFTLGVVHVGGWVDKGWEEFEVVDVFSFEEHQTAGIQELRASFVQYRPQVNDAETGRTETITSPCEFAGAHEAVVIDLQDVFLRPTHYSLRYSGCVGMTGDWNFEGSVDGQTWDVLHEARDDNSLNTSELQVETKIQPLLEYFRERNRTVPLDSVTFFFEQHFRKTWDIQANYKFFRYFRIIGPINPVIRRGRAGVRFYGCLHCVGLELFGDVYEM